MLKYIRGRRTSLRLLPSKTNQLAIPCPTATASGVPGVQDDDEENEQDQLLLSLELNLEATKVEISVLKDENEKMKEKLSEAQKSLKEKELKIDDLEGKIEGRGNEIEALRQELYLEKGKFNGQQRSLNELKGFVKKIYTVAGVVLEGLGGNAPPFHEIEEGDGNSQLETFCRSLQVKFLEWQGNHQLMHNELERTLKIVEDFSEQVEEATTGVNYSNGESLPAIKQGPGEEEDEEEQVMMISKEEKEPAPPTPSTSKSRPAQCLSKEDQNSLELSRRNPLRKCRLVINSYDENTACWQHLAEYTRFACEYCGDAFCRLAHVSSQLTKIRNKRRALMPASSPPSAQTPPLRIKRKFRSKSESGRVPNNPPDSKRFHSLSKSETGGQEDKSMNRLNKRDPTQPRVRPQVVVVESSGKEHRFAGYYNTILPKEQVNCRLAGIAPKKKRRYFCKCGKNYAGWNGLYYHLKFVETGTWRQFQCNLCQESFKLRTALKAHLQRDHKIDYLPGKFNCLECRKSFVGTMKEIVAHRKLFHSNNNDEEDGYISA